MVEIAWMVNRVKRYDLKQAHSQSPRHLLLRRRYQADRQ